MKKINLLMLLLVAALSLTGCLKSEEKANYYHFKPLAQYTSGDLGVALDDFKAYAFEVDTTLWGVASFDDALQGILTSKENPSEQYADYYSTSEPTTLEGLTDRYALRLPESDVMVLAVDPVNRLYGYTQVAMKPAVGNLYVTLIFKPWKETTAYKEGTWSFYNPEYKPLPKLETFVEATAQEEEGGSDRLEIATMKIYAFAADTTLWKIRSYEDAVGGIITSAIDPSQQRTVPEYNAYETNEPSRYRMTVDREPLMIVAVDRTHARYAYTEQHPDLEGESPTYSIVFRLWMNERWKVEEDGWCVVNPALDPAQEGKKEQ